MADSVGRNLTILLTDIKEFTPKTSGMSRQDILNLLAKHKEIVLPILENRGGKLVKTMGDAFLVVFESPTDAVLAGVEVQDALKKYNENKSDKDRIDVRIAINQGEVTLTDNDVFGEPVNITSRLESVAKDGEVFFTEAVYLASSTCAGVMESGSPSWSMKSKRVMWGGICSRISWTDSSRPSTATDCHRPSNAVAA